MWVSTRSEPNFTRWGTGEPNNTGDEDCGELEVSGYWNDEDCKREIWAICEMQ